MSKPHIVTARLDAETFAGLNRLAAYHERSRAWLVAKAIGRYVEDETRFFEFLEEGEDALVRGDFVTHEDLVAEIAAMRKHKQERAA